MKLQPPNRLLQRGTRLRACAAVFACWIAIHSPTTAAPSKQFSDDAVLLELDAGQRETSRALRARRSSTRQANDDPRAAMRLAEQFIALGRAQHDERYFGYASAVLHRWNRDVNAPAPIVALRADIAQHQHRFAEAQSILQTLIARDEADARVWLMSATLHMSQGQPAAAKQACQKIFSVGESFMGTICIAHAASINGQLTSSYRLVSNLLEQLPFDGATAQYSWSLGVVADMAERSGDANAAARWLRKAIELSPDDLVSRLTLCDSLLEGGRANEVLTLLETQTAAEPVLLRRALAAKQLGGAQASNALQAWQLAVRRSEELGVTLHLRELAIGQLDLLDQPKVALQTALLNWEVQREPIDARLLLRAARKAENAEAVRRVREWQTKLRYEDKALL